MPTKEDAPKRLTDEQKVRILFLANQGASAGDIAKELGVKTRTVNGYIQSCINQGKLNSQVHRHVPQAPPPPQAPSEVALMASAADPSAQAEPMMPPPPPLAPPPPPVQMAPQPRPVAPPPMPRVVQAPAPVPAASYNDGFSSGRVAAGYNNGWNSPQMIVRYQIERKVPFDGIVGQHTHPFTEADLCQMYGEGLYRVLRYEPGRPVPTEFDVKVGPNFGPPKYPKQGVSSGENRTGYNRPAWGRQGQWDRQGADEDQEPRRPAGYDRPLDYYSQRHAAPAPSPDASASVAASAIEALSRANERAIQQSEKARENGPDTFLSNFMKAQQDVTNDRWERERLQAEERRREERQQAEDRRKEEQERWERHQKEKEEDHKKELERIRMDGEAKAKVAAEERKMIMELEDKKLQVIREEHKIRQDQMAEELRLSREQAKLTEERLAKQMAEIKEKTEDQIQATQESVKTEMDREKNQIDREFELRKSSLETEHKLQEKILEVRQEQLQQQGGNEVFNTINTLIKEFSKGLEKVVELKKVQSSSPEAQVAMVAAGATAPQTDGNVKAEVEEKPEAEMGETKAQAPRAEQGGNVNMEKLIQDMMDEPFFKEVMKEWALHVEEEASPDTFANMYLEWMRDPEHHQTRQACSMFANVMKVRNWKRLLAILEPKLSPEILTQFRKPYATDFYDGFKAMVLEQIRAYWQGFLEDQQKRDEEKRSGGSNGNGNGHGHAPVQAQPPPAAKAQGPQAIVEPDDEPPPAPPVPTRESLRTKTTA
jgi:DNA-binding XRE family transcriptional regulator